MPQTITPRQAARIVGSPYTPFRLRLEQVLLTKSWFGEVVSILSMVGLWFAFSWQAIFLAPMAQYSNFLHVPYPDMCALVVVLIASMQSIGLVLQRRSLRVVGIWLATLLSLVVCAGSLESSGLTIESGVGIGFCLIGVITYGRM